MIFCGVEIPQHIQGQAFLGPKAEAPRDRYDEMYDTVRAVRDKRFKYIRHYHPEKPYMLYNRYRNIHPIMQEMWRLHTAGELAGPSRRSRSRSRSRIEAIWPPRLTLTLKRGNRVGSVASPGWKLKRRAEKPKGSKGSEGRYSTRQTRSPDWKR